MDDIARIAFDHAPVGIVMTRHRVIEACNQTFCDLSGYGMDALLGQSFRMLYGSEAEFIQIRDIGLEPLRRDGAYADERMLRHAGGHAVWCRFRARTLTPADPLARIVMSFAPITPRRDGPSLTGRERQVVTWLARGKTSKEIAQVLSLSPRTIEDVRARLMRKFDVRNTALLLARLSDLGQ
ncbi:MAG: PAS and helix-turn-helix domain-containing protein [Rhodobacterales bacterium]|nr:PAS and helix-turn-helix domain-containing protein [Rhodobacterales bacterium]MDX5388727.1 PAS and helix-turn-helix domain-containing protein [Rhodobacterales bacterium]MDX5488416.1 PAS and helix-turn-helix domain-containing protein [Rhodobacterales bacterium]